MSLSMLVPLSLSFRPCLFSVVGSQQLFLCLCLRLLSNITSNSEALHRGVNLCLKSFTRATLYLRKLLRKPLPFTLYLILSKPLKRFDGTKTELIRSSDRTLQNTYTREKAPFFHKGAAKESLEKEGYSRKEA